ncbi:nicotinamide-nucleotide amidohydrolase family protein [Thermodesulfobacteriota bacterium]
MDEPFKGLRILKVYGLNKSSITEALKTLSDRRDDIEWEVLPFLHENHIVISLEGYDNTILDMKLDRMEKEIFDILNPFVFASGDQKMEEVVGNMLEERDLTISVAESCTGGLIGNLLTNVPGSSSYFLGGVIVYSNRSKVDLLNVSSKTIQEYGAVSDQAVREMAEGVKKKFKSPMGLAITGIAGPSGGSTEKPVGTVFIGLAVEKEVFSGRYRFHGAREQIKQNSSTMALDWVRRYLNDDPFLPGI